MRCWLGDQIFLAKLVRITVTYSGRGRAYRGGGFKQFSRELALRRSRNRLYKPGYSLATASSITPAGCDSASEASTDRSWTREHTGLPETFSAVGVTGQKRYLIFAF